MSDRANETIQERALRLLKAIKLKTENSGQPVFVEELAHDLTMDGGQAKGAFRYLVDRRWIDTFNFPYAGRINAAGHDVLREVERRQTNDNRVVASSASREARHPIDREAEAAVRRAIERLIAEGERPYSLNVPITAETRLVQHGRGRIARNDATERTKRAMLAMVERGELEAYVEPFKDWVLHDTVAQVPDQDQGHMDARDQIEQAMEWDVFISHASEDKEDLVRPLAERLRDHDLHVWYDEFTLTVGDSLRQSIDRGLARSRYGIVVISPNFLQKRWPQKELDGLVAREVSGASVKVILPVWHNIGAAEIRAYSPTLADRLAASSANGLEQVTGELLQAIRKGDDHRPAPRSQPSIAGPRDSARPQIPTARPDLEPLNRYASEFHRRRTEQILAGKAPVALLDGGALVMHLVPFGAVDGRPADTFEEISSNPNTFPPMLDTYSRDFRITYDGLLTGSHADGLVKPQRAYVHVNRSAIVEAVVSSLAKGRDHNFVELPHVQAIIIKYAYLYAKSLDGFGVRAPIWVGASIINMRGMTLLQDFICSASPKDCGALDRNHLEFGSALFETVPPDLNAGAKLLRPILSHLANAASLNSSPYFDADGNYTLKM